MMSDSEDDVIKQQTYAGDITTSSDEDSGRESDLQTKTESSWHKKKTIPKFPFNKTGYIKVKPDNQNMIDYFELLFNKTFISNLISSINTNAIRNFISHANGYIKTESWSYIIEKETKTFLALLLYINHMNEDNLEAVWKKQLFNKPIKNYMSYKRFMALLKNFCYSDKNKSGNFVNDPSQYIEHITDYFNNTMEALITPTKNLTIDATNIKSNVETKAYWLTDAKGVINKVKFYYDVKHQGTKHITKAVLELMGDNLYSGHSLFLNKYFTSVYLAEVLIGKKTHITGELSSKSNDNPDIAMYKTHPNATMTKYNSRGVSISNFGTIEDRDKKSKSRLIISTEFEAEDVSYDKQTSFIEYKKILKAIDRKKEFNPNELRYYDSVCNDYSKITIQVVNVMLYNAFIIYTEDIKNDLDNKVTFKQFLFNIVHKLLDQNTKEDTKEIVSKITDLNNEIIHLPEHIENDVEAECVRCFQTLFKVEHTKFYCSKCEDLPGLCLTCFRSYHNY